MAETRSRVQEGSQRRRREDRPIYIPQGARQRVRNGAIAEHDGVGQSLATSTPAFSSGRGKEREHRAVELLGRHGRIDGYEFEFVRQEDADYAAATLARYGDVAEGGASLVRHVETPIDTAMTSRKLLVSRGMHADVEEGQRYGENRNGHRSGTLLDPSEGTRGFHNETETQGRFQDSSGSLSYCVHDAASVNQPSGSRRLLEEYELLLPAHQRELPWKRHIPAPNGVFQRPLAESSPRRAASARKAVRSVQSTGANDRAGTLRPSDASRSRCGLANITASEDASLQSPPPREDTAFLRHRPSAPVEFPVPPGPPPIPTFSSWTVTGDRRRRTPVAGASKGGTREPVIDRGNVGRTGVVPGVSGSNTSLCSVPANVPHPEAEKQHRHSKPPSGFESAVVERQKHQSLPPPMAPATYKSFEFELYRRFPSAFSRRLLIAMWVSFCRSSVHLRSVFSGTAGAEAACVQGRTSEAPEEDHMVLAGIDSAFRYFKGILDRVTQLVLTDPQLSYKALRPSTEATRLDFFIKRGRMVEATHFLCHLYVILGDLCRYRDVYKSQVLQKSQMGQTNALSSRGFASFPKDLTGHLFFLNSMAWYSLATDSFALESRTYSQLGDVLCRTGDQLGQMIAILRSIISVFRTRNEDQLTVLLETGSIVQDSATGGEALNKFGSRLLPLVQSLYSKIGLEQFETRLARVTGALEESVAASIPSKLLDLLLKGFLLILLMTVETSGLWQEQAAKGDEIDSAVKTVGLQLRTARDVVECSTCTDAEKEHSALGAEIKERDSASGNGTGEKDFQSEADTLFMVTDPNYTAIADSLHATHGHLSLTYAALFRKADLRGLIRQNERFRLSITALVRLTITVIEAVRSPLSPLLAVVSYVALWLSSTGILAAFEEIDSTDDSLTPDERGFLFHLQNLRCHLTDVLLVCAHETVASSTRLKKKCIHRCRWFFSGISTLESLRNHISSTALSQKDAVYSSPMLLTDSRRDCAKASAVDDRMLSYALPEDQLLRGCVSIPVEFCIPSAIVAEPVLDATVVKKVEETLLSGTLFLSQCVEEEAVQFVLPGPQRPLSNLQPAWPNGDPVVLTSGDSDTLNSHLIFTAGTTSCGSKELVFNIGEILAAFNPFAADEGEPSCSFPITKAVSATASLVERSSKDGRPLQQTAGASDAATSDGAETVEDTERKDTLSLTTSPRKSLHVSFSSSITRGVVLSKGSGPDSGHNGDEERAPTIEKQNDDESVSSGLTELQWSTGRPVTCPEARTDSGGLFPAISHVKKCDTVMSSENEEMNRRSSLSSIQETPLPLSTPSSSRSPQRFHSHVKAVGMCPNHLTSLARLSRLLIISSTFPEFRAAFAAPHHEGLTEAATNLKDDLELLFDEGRTEPAGSGAQCSAESVDGQPHPEALGGDTGQNLFESGRAAAPLLSVAPDSSAAHPVSERRGLLRIKPSAFGKPPLRISGASSPEPGTPSHASLLEGQNQSQLNITSAQSRAMLYSPEEKEPGKFDKKPNPRYYLRGPIASPSTQEAETLLFRAIHPMRGGPLRVLGQPRSPKARRAGVASGATTSPALAAGPPSRIPVVETTTAGAVCNPSCLSNNTSVTARPPQKHGALNGKIQNYEGSLLPLSGKSALRCGRLVVIDGSNVAHRHGSATSKKFSSAGIQYALDYYLKRNFNAIAFVPEYVTNYRDVGDNKRLQRAGVKQSASKIPDDVQLLRDLSDQGLLITTPPQDYDDSYIIQYAMNHGGCIVSNDRYRDHKANEQRNIRKWLKTHLISFTFICDEFMPNPDFVFPDEEDG